MQGGMRPPTVARIPLAQVLQNARVYTLLAPLKQLLMAPGGAGFHRGRKEKFHIGVWADHRADVAPVQHGAVPRSLGAGRGFAGEAALEVQQGGRSGERREGKECVSTGRTRG